MDHIVQYSYDFFTRVIITINHLRCFRHVQELAAVVCCIATDGFKAKNAFFRYQPSWKVQVSERSCTS